MIAICALYWLSYDARFSSTRENLVNHGDVNGGNAIERNELGLWCWGALDVGEDIFASGSGIVGLNFDPIIPETHSDLGCTISLTGLGFVPVVSDTDPCTDPTRQYPVPEGTQARLNTMKVRRISSFVRSQTKVRAFLSGTDRDLCRVPEIYLTLTSEMGNRVI